MGVLRKINVDRTDLSGLTEIAKGRKVVILLSSGGLRIVCHLPLLRILEALELHVDELWGVSAGSIAGGLWASGLSAADIEDAIRTVKKSQIYELYPLTALRALIPSMNTEKVGFLTGVKLEKHLARLLGPGNNPFLDIRDFRVLAYNRTQNCKAVMRLGEQPNTIEITQAESKQTTVEKGTFVDMLRASFATPVMFQPKRLNGQLYIDGGIAENYPVLTAFSHYRDELETRRECRDLLMIGVNISYSGQFAKRRTNIIKSIAESYDILGAEFSKLHLGLLDAMVSGCNADCKIVTIDPGIHDLALTDFKRIPETLEKALAETLNALSKV